MASIAESLKNLFSKKQQSAESTEQADDKIIAAQHWYYERYETVVTQRNLLSIILILALAIVVVSVIGITYVSTSKEFDPFVIQIDQQTGTTEVVDPLTSKVLGGNEALDRYFIKKYVTARETYNPVDFNTYARDVIRLLSDSTVYWNYLGYINNKRTNPTIIYGAGNTTYLTVRSWSKLEKDTYVFRFSITETAGAKTTVNKIAIIKIAYVPMRLNEQDREINPVGFQIIGYKVDNDDS